MALPNPSMSFSPFAILTAEEMNDLVENIESLADGSGFNAGAIDTEDVADDAITGEKVDWPTVTLGYAQKTSSQAQASTSTVAITDLTTTVTVPPGGCDLKITIWIGEISTTGLNTPVISLRDGASTVAYWRQTIAANGYYASACVIHKATFSAGSHTFAAYVGASAATSFTIAAAAGNPAFILVERV